VVTAVALLASIGIAWFLLTGKAVYIQTVPAGAAVDISGGFKLKLADRFLLRPGEYRLRLSAEGYRPLTTTLTVGGKQDQEYRFELSRLPGHLAVSSRPSGAGVTVDGEPRGTTPLTVDELAHGRHQVRLEVERHLPYEQAVAIEGLDKTQKLNISLDPAWAEVTLRSTPAGAEVFVDDDSVGSTPLTAEILRGQREVRVKLEGYKAWRRTLTVKAGESIAITDIRLQPADALVRVRTRPPGAGVTVNGEYQGVSPLEAALEPGQAADIRLFKQGYQRTARSVKLASGEQRTLDVTLQPQLAAISVQAEPAAARLWVDGKDVGDANRTVKLTAREHHIEIRAEGYQPYETTVTPRPGIEQAIRIRLMTLREARLAAMKPVITTAAGQEMKLLRPDARFTTGASRREPGRRANETRRQIRLTRGFYLSLQEVTNAQYRRFDPEHRSGDVRGHSLDGERQPVVNISWQEAARYCNWLSGKDGLTPFYREDNGAVTGINAGADGYRLPTEVEWAWAARYLADGSLLKYPWGDEMPPPENSGNYADQSAANLIGRIISGYNDGHAVTAAAGSLPASGRGLYDIGGNVAEWVNDFYDIMISGADRVSVDPLGPENGDHHVIRGSSWAHGTITELRLSYRDYGSEPRNDVGFRIARFMEGGKQ